MGTRLAAPDGSAEYVCENIASVSEVSCVFLTLWWGEGGGVCWAWADWWRSLILIARRRREGVRGGRGCEIVCRIVGRRPKLRLVDACPCSNSVSQVVLVFGSVLRAFLPMLP